MTEHKVLDESRTMSQSLPKNNGYRNGMPVRHDHLNCLMLQISLGIHFARAGVCAPLV